MNTRTLYHNRTQNASIFYTLIEKFLIDFFD
nr:MAG TPA: hypothetical protein [Caudoviricetes sp.]